MADRGSDGTTNGLGAPLNRDQRRRVEATFAQVDDLLGTVERLASTEYSPFARERADIAPDEGRLLSALVAALRERLAQSLEGLGLPRPEPTVSARWSAATTLTFAHIALSELTPQTLRGYGPLDDATGRAVMIDAEDLQRLVERGRAILHERVPGGLIDRLRGLPDPAGTVLRTLEVMSRTHGLVAIRPLIAAAAERATAATFDIGVFGRVSAGKSSLINELIGSPVLPVGATPVTAVPVRISRGDAGLTVRFHGAAARRVALTEISTYVTEQANPSNTRDVVEVDVAVPTMPSGLRWLDTPGVGSLATTGPSYAYAWLPRCDLGLVLVPAGAPVGREELALVSGLAHAGIACQVLLSKADLVSSDELTAVLAHIRAELRRALPGTDIEIRPVSSRLGAGAGMADWRRETLEPVVAEHLHRRRQALAARLHRLVSLADVARNGHGGGLASGDAHGLAGRRQSGRAAIASETDALTSAAEAMLADAASAVLLAWQRGDDAQAAVRGLVIARVAASLAAVRQAVDDAHAPDQAHGQAMPERPRRLPPIFDPPFLDSLPDLSAPRLHRLLGHQLAAKRLACLADPLRDALVRYAARLHAWGTGQLDQLDEVSASIETARADVSADMQELHCLIDRGIEP